MSLLELLLLGADWGSPIVTKALLVPILGFPLQFQGSYLNSQFPIPIPRFPSQFLCSHPSSWIPIPIPTFPSHFLGVHLNFCVLNSILAFPSWFLDSHFTSWHCCLTSGVPIPFPGVSNFWVPTSLPVWGSHLNFCALSSIPAFPLQFLVFPSQFLDSHPNSWVVDPSSQGFVPSS